MCQPEPLPCRQIPQPYRRQNGSHLTIRETEARKSHRKLRHGLRMQIRATPSGLKLAAWGPTWNVLFGLAWKGFHGCLN